MFEFLLATGKYGVIGVALVFIVVFLLATPGKEISFWGIRFHKRHKRRLKIPRFWSRAPSELPLNCDVVLAAFSSSDEYHLSKDQIYAFAKRLDVSKLEATKAIYDLEKFDLVSDTMSYVYLTSKGVLRLSKDRQNKEE